SLRFSLSKLEARSSGSLFSSTTNCSEIGTGSGTAVASDIEPVRWCHHRVGPIKFPGPGPIREKTIPMRLCSTICSVRSRRLFSGQTQLDAMSQEIFKEAVRGSHTGAKSGSEPDIKTPKSTSTPQLAVLANNVMVATSGAVSPAVGLMWKIPAGSRYEDASTTGLSHYLRHAFFAVSQAYCCDKFVGEFQGESNVVKSIGNILANFKLEYHQLADIEERVVLDRELYAGDVEAQLWDNAFEVAFRTGLGNSTISSGKNENVSVSSLNSFLKSSFERSGHVVVADGIEQVELMQAVKSSFSQTVPSHRPGVPQKFFGGERRFEWQGEQNHVLVAFGTSGSVDRTEANAIRILKALIGAHTSVRYGTLQSHLTGLKGIFAKNNSVSMSVASTECVDGGLLGIKVTTPRQFGVNAVLDTLCGDLKSLTQGNLTPDALVAAKTRASFELALADGKISDPVNDHLKQISSMTTNEFKNIISKILLRKSVMISAGNLKELPYADEISF
ncbi:LuxS/MPP-like metallohydrolase, partial [Paramicrosporidium saccamoebae]